MMNNMIKGPKVMVSSMFPVADGIGSDITYKVIKNPRDKFCPKCLRFTRLVYCRKCHEFTQRR